MNGFPDTQTAERFDTDDYQMLVVAEKYQTGFDQPLLLHHVRRQDAHRARRRADPVAAEPHPPGQGRHVRPRLPQRRRGDPERVRAVLRRDRRPADRPEPALRHPPRPRRVRRPAPRRDRRTSSPSCWPTRTRSTTAASTPRSPPPSTGSTRPRRRRAGPVPSTPSTASCAPTASCPRSCRSATPTWNATTCSAGRSAAFIQRDPAARRSTSARTSNSPTSACEKQFEGVGLPRPTTAARSVTIWGGRARGNEPEPETLSTIIERFNERYGTDWTDADRLFPDAIAEDLVNDDGSSSRPARNNLDTFKVGFDQTYIDAIASRLDRNEKVAVQLLDNDDLRAALVDRVPAPHLRPSPRRPPTHLPDRRPPRRRPRRPPPRVQVHPPLGHPGRVDEDRHPREGRRQDRRRVPQRRVRRHPARSGSPTTATVYGLEADYATFSKRGEARRPRPVRPAPPEPPRRPPRRRRRLPRRLGVPHHRRRRHLPRQRRARRLPRLREHGRRPADLLVADAGEHRRHRRRE